MSVLFWVLLAIGLAVIEIVSVTFFPIFFTFSAAVAAIIQIAGGADWVQWAAFGAVGLAFSLVLRPIAKRQVAKGPSLRSGIEQLTGRKAVVSSTIEGAARVGAVTIDGQVWSAKAPDGREPIAIGADVEILEVRGATLVVAPISTGVLEK